MAKTKHKVKQANLPSEILNNVHGICKAFAK